jgi:hypothetical protein
LPILLKHRLEKPRRSTAKDKKDKKTRLIKKKKTRGYITEDESESEFETNNNNISDTDEEISDKIAVFTKDTQTRKISCPK